VHYLEGQYDQTVEVLMERSGMGRTPQFAEVVVPEHFAPGAFARVRVCGHDSRRLIAETAS
jgi:tRNA A37 methylthiotransferase MiaB